MSTKRKQQRDEGRIRALKYFTDIMDVGAYLGGINI